MNRRNATLATLGALTWGAAPAQATQQGWAVYSNAQLGIAFKYPAAMKVTTYEMRQKRVADFVALTPYAQVSFEVAVNATDRTLTDYISAYLRVLKAQTIVVPVGGVDAVKAKIVNPNPGNFYYFMRPDIRTPVFSLGFMGETAALERELLDSVRYSEPDGSFVNSGEYLDYGVMFGSDDSELGKTLRRTLGIK